MPEWVTHTVFAFFLALLLRREKKSLVVFGALLPDIVQKLAWPAAYLIGEQAASSIFGIGHTPAFSLLLSLAIASLLPGEVKKNLLSLSIGWVSHYALDMLQGPFGQQLLWPLSQQEFGFFLWYSDSPIPITVTLIALAAYATYKMAVRKEKIAKVVWL